MDIELLENPERYKKSQFFVVGHYRLNGDDKGTPIFVGDIKDHDDIAFRLQHGGEVYISPNAFRRISDRSDKMKLLEVICAAESYPPMEPELLPAYNILLSWIIKH